jgi:branched-chain amino acid aminotransferase
MLGTNGFLAEGSIESILIVKDGVLRTPPLGRVLASITRKSILEAVSQAGIPAVEAAISEKELLDADELFSAHTGIKVSPIHRLEYRELEAPGPVTRKFMDLMDNIIAFQDKRFAGWFQHLA